MELIGNLFNRKKNLTTRTKTINISVHLPYAVQLVKVELKKVKFVSILEEALNHKAIKLVPVIVRCFSTTTDEPNNAGIFLFTWRDYRINP